MFVSLMANEVRSFTISWTVFLMLVFVFAHGASKEDLAFPGVCKSGVVAIGYECEEHSVTTDDGYILSIQRIPTGRSSNNTGNKIPVLVQHGALTDGVIWLLNSPDQSLAYILADNGFDVWIANGRGTVYSQGHTSLSPTDSAYWDWSWDALVDYELPAIFEYVYTQTNQQRIHYVGHSEGTLTALASFAEQKLLDMIRSAALLCPIAYLDHITSIVSKAVADIFVGDVINWLGIHEFDPVGKEAKFILQQICDKPGIDCDDLLTPITGKNCCVNSSILENFLGHEPQPTSTKNIIQLSQMVRSGTITKYDYGNIFDNLKHYGQIYPPAYDMSAIPNDLSLFLSYGGEDSLADVVDVQQLLDDLSSHEDNKLKVQFVPNYAHGDYVLAFNVKGVVYDSVIAFFNDH